MKNLSGLCVPICTPFDESGEHVDEVALREHIDAMLAAGVDIILVCGGTGEFAFLRPDEKKQLVEVAAQHIDDRALFMVQTSDMSTADAINSAKHAEDFGAHAVMIMPPHYEGGPDDAGVIGYFEEIAAAIGIPIMIYHAPQFSGVDITSCFDRLLRIDNVKYVKDSSGDFARSQEMLAAGAIVFSGDDTLGFSAVAAGFPGCMWGSINVMPEQAVTLQNLVKSGDMARGRELWSQMIPVLSFIRNHVYNAAVKAAVNMSGRSIGPCRKPLLPLTDTERRELRSVLEPLGLVASA